jgi:hypothetical protein
MDKKRREAALSEPMRAAGSRKFKDENENENGVAIKRQ